MISPMRTCRSLSILERGLSIGSELHVHEFAVSCENPSTHLHGKLDRKACLLQGKGDLVKRNGVVDRELANEIIRGRNLRFDLAHAGAENFGKPADRLCR